MRAPEPQLPQPVEPAEPQAEQESVADPATKPALTPAERTRKAMLRRQLLTGSSIIRK